MATQPAVRGWTYAEFARLPDDGNRHEIIAGEHVVTPSPSPHHTRIAFKLGTLLDAFVERHALGWVTTAPVDVLLGPDDYLQPDVVFVGRDKGAEITARGIEVPPDLVVEVLSPATALRDRGIKRERYAAFGIPEYWIVDPERRRLEVHRLADGADAPSHVVDDAYDWRPVPGGPVLTLRLADFVHPFA